MITAGDTVSGHGEEYRNLTPVINKFKLWKTDEVEAFWQRCLEADVFARLKPFAALFRGPPRSAFRAAEKLSATVKDAYATNADDVMRAVKAVFKETAISMMGDVKTWVNDNCRGVATADSEDGALSSLYIGFVKQALLAMRCPPKGWISLDKPLPATPPARTSDSAPVSRPTTWQSLLSSGMVVVEEIAFIDSECGTLLVAENPALSVGATTYLQQSALSPCSVLSALLGSDDVLEKHPSESQLKGFVLETACGLALTESSNRLDLEFLEYMKRFEYNGHCLPALWHKMLERVLKVPQCVLPLRSDQYTWYQKFSDIKRFKTAAELLTAVSQADPQAFFAYYLPDANAGPDGIWFIRLHEEEGGGGGGGGAVAATSFTKESNMATSSVTCKTPDANATIVAVIVGCQWFASTLDQAMRDMSQRSVDPHFLYCDLEQPTPTPKADCTAQYESCRTAIRNLMPKLAGVMSIEFFFEHDKHKPHAQAGRSYEHRVSSRA